MRDAMKNVKSEDLRLLHRMVDGELSDLVPGQLASFERRLAAEPVLAEALEQLRSLRGLFAPGRGARTPVPPPGFTDSVLAAVRQEALAGAATSDNRKGTAGGAGDRTAVICRRVLLLAAAIAAVAVLLHTWMLTSRVPEHLQAAPADIQLKMKEIDALPPADPEVERR
jgi:hypothetical protein